MSDFNVKDSINKAIALMQRKLDDFERQEEIENSDVWPLTQIAKTLAVIDKQSKDSPEDLDDLSSLTPEDIDKLAKETVASMKEKLK